MFPNNDTGQALKRLSDDGADLSLPMEFDFFIAIPSERLGLRIASEVSRLDFETSVEFDSEVNEWTCYCTKKIIPSYENIEKIEQELSQIASKLGGNYDGFGSFGN